MTVEDLLVRSRALRTIPERELGLRHRVHIAPTVPAVDTDIWWLHVSFYVTRKAEYLGCLVEHHSGHTRTLGQ